MLHIEYIVALLWINSINSIVLGFVIFVGYLSACENMSTERDWWNKLKYVDDVDAVCFHRGESGAARNPWLLQSLLDNYLAKIPTFSMI